MILWDFPQKNIDQTKEYILNYPFHFRISYFFIEKWDDIKVLDNASLYLFYIIKGKGFYEDFEWKEGDLILCSYRKEGIQLFTSEETNLIIIHNNPFLETMGVKPYRSIFRTRILKEDINSEYIKKIVLKSKTKNFFNLKKNTFFISISNVDDKLVCFINSLEKIIWCNGKILFLEEEKSILFENKDTIDHFFLKIE